MLLRIFWLVVVVCAFLPGVVQAQQPERAGPLHNYGYPYGPRVAPPWSYPGLTGGPSVGYADPPSGSAHKGVLNPNGPVCRPRVPVYEPAPRPDPSHRVTRQWRTEPYPLLAGYGWSGLYKASPRPHHPNVSAWPSGTYGGAGTPLSQSTGACLVVSVKVPQGAEVLVDGQKTVQTGTERTFESPPLEAGKSYQYTVTARWIEGGRVVELSKAVTGSPGEVVNVDFGAPTVAAGK